MGPSLDSYGNYLANPGVPASGAAVTAGVGQMVTYTAGTPPNPPNVNGPAIAYDPAGILPMMNWNTTTQLWV